VVQLSSDRGFTLIEVLVALVLVSVLVAGAMGVLAKAAAVIGAARVGTTATLLPCSSLARSRTISRPTAVCRLHRPRFLFVDGR